MVSTQYNVSVQCGCKLESFAPRHSRTFRITVSRWANPRWASQIQPACSLPKSICHLSNKFASQYASKIIFDFPDHGQSAPIVSVGNQTRPNEAPIGLLLDLAEFRFAALSAPFVSCRWHRGPWVTSAPGSLPLPRLRLLLNPVAALLQPQPLLLLFRTAPALPHRPTLLQIHLLRRRLHSVQSGPGKLPW